MSGTKIGLAVWSLWLVAFLALELPAHWGWVPWPTLSSELWWIEDWWRVFRFVVVAFLAILAVHLAWRVSAGFLIATAIGGLAAAALHLLLGP